MKVLLTGCSASQSSQKLGERFPTFTSLLSAALSYSGHQVVWDTPSIRWDEDYLSTFDSVVVGLSTPTSVSAHRLYGALSVIEKAKNVTNVRYLLDSPDPSKVWYGLKSVIDNPNNLTKDFYSKRSEYSLAIQQDNSSRLHSVIEDLYNNPWEKTLVPAFPWFKASHITDYIPNVSPDNVKPLCLDSLLLTAMSSTSLYMKSDSNFWSYDIQTPWVKKVEKTITNEARPMTKNKWSNNSETLINLNKSIGSIISTHKNGDPWWSVNLSQSLFVSTPVVTDWRHTSYLAPEWSLLAHQLEELTQPERARVASAQRESYIKVISNFDESIQGVLSSVF